MATALTSLFPFVVFFFFFFFSTSGSFVEAAGGKSGSPADSLLQTSCLHTSYPALCFRTLSSVAASARTPHEVALAAVSVSKGRASRASAFASRLAALRGGRRRERSALKDCVEQLSDSADQLARTASELRHLRSKTFAWQMSNAQTWVSAALTNEDTCLDGFQGVDGSVKTAVRKKVVNAARVTSNALALINRLASARAVHAP